MAQICDNLKYMTDTHEVSGRGNAEKGEIAPIGSGIFTAPWRVGEVQMSVISLPWWVTPNFRFIS